MGKFQKFPFFKIPLRTDDVLLKRDPHGDSDKHWPFLLEVARALYGTHSLRSARLLALHVPVSKFEKRSGKYNVEQIKTLLKCKGLKQSGK